MSRPILVIGIGDTAKGDDGLGVHIVRLLELNSHLLPDTVDLLQAASVGTDLLPCMRGRSKIVIVDAIDTGDVPGIVYRVSIDDVPLGVPLTVRDTSIPDLVRQLKLLGDDPEVELVAVSALDALSPRQGLSPDVQRALPAAIEVVLGAISARQAAVTESFI